MENGENGRIGAVGIEIGLSLVKKPTGTLNSLFKLVPVGMGKSSVIPVVPAGSVEVIVNARLPSQAPVAGFSVASEQKKIVLIVTPSDTVDALSNSGDPSSPYADRVLVGTEFADAVNAIANSAAPPPITFKIFMWPPRFRQECLKVSQHFHAQPRK
jgi:hypothetical protein